MPQTETGNEPPKKVSVLRQVPEPGEPPTVSVQDLSITYRTTFEKVPTFKSAIVRFGRGERAVREVHAVQNMSFDVARGTAMGLIGANGALSGRENVILGGLAAGLSREAVEDRAQEIAEFAEIVEFMDMPMRTYSSGMFQRLAFSVSVHMDPDILLIDEALSAGDASFKVKAAQKMHELMSSSRAMFLVSHSQASIEEMCDEAIWIHKGKLMMRGEPRAVGKEYNRFLKVGESAFTLDDF